MTKLTDTSDFIEIGNLEVIPTASVPALPYGTFYEALSSLLQAPFNHCVSYHAYRQGSDLRFVAAVANDQTGRIAVLSHVRAVEARGVLPALSQAHFPLHIFEREIHENFGVIFSHHPWLKPVRYAFNRADQQTVMADYPFYQIGGQELHQVGVGPIHAGVIEPGHFRFLCNGEKVLHLEIQLGWQHRGIEDLFLRKETLLQRTILAESIAADTAVGHAIAFAGLVESLSGQDAGRRLDVERTIGLELERIAMHVGDLANMNIGTAYQLAASVFGTLRTPAINFTQAWCGNRFGKGLIRVGGSHYPLTDELIDKLLAFLDRFEESFGPMCARLFSLPSALGRFENIGKVSQQQMESIGAVGMTARMAGVPRDIRVSHPFAAYRHFQIGTDTLIGGDVWARAYLRKLEIESSIAYVRELVAKRRAMKEPLSPPAPAVRLTPDSTCFSLVEGWRGEICHAAVTDSAGRMVHYKIKDPSVHNWLALALSLRDLEISDFPINNKSYNLSYCGHDL